MKKVFTVFVALLSLSIAAVAFLPEQQKNLIAEIFVEPTYNSLSGREGNDGEILVVKIDDTRSARPQIGVDRADIVYIEQVEGGLTRLAAVFSSEIPTLIGPIRSARISDIEILAQYGRVVFAYSGAQSKLLPVIAAANLNDYGAQRQSPPPRRTTGRLALRGRPARVRAGHHRGRGTRRAGADTRGPSGG